MPTGEPRLRQRASILLLGLSVCLAPGAVSAQEYKSKNVLLVYPHEREMSIYTNLDQSLRSTITSGSAYPVEFYTEYLDLMRFPEDRHRRSTLEHLRIKYADRRPDLIVVVSSLAFDFVRAHRDMLFPGIPIVFASVNRTKIDRGSLDSNMTGIAVKRDIASTLEVALRLQPDTARVLVPVGVTPIEQAWTADARKSLQPYEDRVDIMYVSGPMNEILYRVKNLPPHSIVLFARLLFYDATGRYFVPDDALALICEASRVPVYGTDEPYLGLGIVGGALYSLEPTGVAAGLAAQRILAGERPASIPVQTLDPNQNRFDARQLRRWNISESRLPPHSVVQYADRSIWDLYHGYIVAFTAVLLLQFAFIFALARQARKLKQSESLLKDLSGHLMRTQEDERTGVARELHDDLGQRLALVKLELEMLSQKLPVHEAVCSAKLHDVLLTVDELAIDLHHLSGRLHSSRLQFVGLHSALQGLCSELSRQRGGVAIEFRSVELAHEVPHEVARCFYRVAEEALQDVATYPLGSRIVVTLVEDQARLRMKIWNSGGVRSPSGSEALVVASMRERLRLIGGELLIHTAPGGGTALTVQVALPPQRPAMPDALVKQSS